MNRPALTNPHRRDTFHARLHAAQEQRRARVIRRVPTDFWLLLSAVAIVLLLQGLIVGLWAVFGAGAA